MKAAKFFEIARKVLLSPWTSLLTMSAGVFMGIYYKDLALSLQPFGQSYLALLSMCVYPVLLTAIATSIAALVRSGHGGRRLEAMAALLVVFVLSAALAGTLGGVFGRPGDTVSDDARVKMAAIVDKAGSASSLEMNFYSENETVENGYSLSKLLKEAIGSNIFESLSENRSLQVLFFSIVLGIALGSLKGKAADGALSTLDSFYKAFIKIIKWAMYPLSFGLFCLVSSEVSKLGFEIILSMAGFLAIFYVVGLSFVGGCVLIIWTRTDLTLWRSVAVMKDPIIISVGARNSLAALPSAIEAMTSGIGFKEGGPKLLLPLAITIGRFGNAMYFALAGVFVAQLYGVHLGLPALCLIVLTGAFAGVATSGATGAVTLTMMMMVLEPMRLPWEAVLALFIAIDTIADPLRTLITVYTSCAFSALLSEREPSRRKRHHGHEHSGSHHERYDERKEKDRLQEGHGESTELPVPSS